MSNVAVIGAGSWGTALAGLLASEGASVSLWARRAEVASAINSTHHNPSYLKDKHLSETIVATNDLSQCLDGADVALIVTPSQSLRELCEALAALHQDPLPLVLCCKGLDAATASLESDVVTELLGSAFPLAVLSGPNHAEEVIAGVPSASVVASADKTVAKSISSLLSSQNFRTYVSSDLVGVQLCGAYKNVIAIAVGCSYGMGFGDNTAAMLLTRGLAEMSRLVVASGGEALTCMGLAGAGDVVVTCMSRHSRNRMFGEDYLAHHKTLTDFEADHHMVVEGAMSCRAIVRLGKRLGVELPIASVVLEVMSGNLSEKDALRALTDRPLKEEFYGLS